MVYRAVYILYACADVVCGVLLQSFHQPGCVLRKGIVYWLMYLEAKNE